MKVQEKTDIIVESLHYVKQFFGSSILIKLGGSILDDMNLVKKLCVDLSLLRAVGIKIVIVHGGSKAINKAFEAYGLESNFHQGQRITTDEMIDAVEMVLRGHVNPLLVRHLNLLGIKAVGLSGVDGGLLQCAKLNPIFGNVGKVEAVNTSILQAMLEQQQNHSDGAIPVIAPIGMGKDGNALNINADWVASKIAVALNIDKLIYLTDEEGIYDENSQLISEIDAAGLQNLIDSGVAKKGMLTKINTIMDAIEHNVDCIHIISGKIKNALITELFTDKGIGTVCHKQLCTTEIKQEVNYA